MKHTFFSPGKLFKTLSFAVAVFTVSIEQSDAQCLVNNLDITTGKYNSSTITPGNNDPLWFCVNKTGNFVGSLPPAGSSALVVTPNGSWGGGGTWICDNQFHVSPGTVTNMTSNLTFERRFSLCSDAEVTFDMAIRSDGLIADILVDNVSQGLTQTSANWSGGPLWNPGTFSLVLSAGPHALEIVVSDPNGTGGADPIGFLLNGSISTTTASITNDQNPQCANYSCRPRCEDQCYWTVDGNNISSNRNIFGTLTDDDIRIVTNLNSAPDRGVIKGGTSATGGYMGWNNTNPTARFHVDCINGNNPGNIIGMPSDIRFENLEPGNGYYLVIDDQGYVYNSKVPAPGGPKGKASISDDMATMQQQIRELKAQLADLRATMVNPSAERADILPRNTLYQNSPNPLSNETTIKYNVVTMRKAAAILISDANGRVIEKRAVEAGEGSINFNSGNMPAGLFTYTLIVDDEVVDTKKMLIAK